MQMINKMQNIRAESMSVILPTKKIQPQMHSVNKAHEKGQHNKTHKSQNHRKFPPKFASQEAAQIDIVNKEQIENGYKMVFSIARRDYWGGIMQCTISSTVWLRKGSWERNRSIAE